ncbi:MAG: hypothetical protein R3C10_04350 [Pirellulales bacterium]
METIARRLLRGQLQGRQQVDRLGLIGETDVGVLHRHPHVAVPGQLPGLNQLDAAQQQPRDVRVPASRVEVGDPFIGLIGDARLFEITLDHFVGLPLRQLREERLVIRKAIDPRADRGD